jgi:hypothetical protein
MLSRSVSSVNHTTEMHKFSIPDSLLAGNRKVARGLHTNTNAYPLALESAYSPCSREAMLRCP